jgi:hypothetical protein
LEIRKTSVVAFERENRLDLLPLMTIRQPGAGPCLDISERRGDLFTFELSIVRAAEHESVDLSIWGSEDGENWGTKPLLSLPHKFYCGTYQGLLDVSAKAGIRYLRASWDVRSWHSRKALPTFTIRLQIAEQEVVPANSPW